VTALSLGLYPPWAAVLVLPGRVSPAAPGHCCASLRRGATTAQTELPQRHSLAAGGPREIARACQRGFQRLLFSCSPWTNFQPRNTSTPPGRRPPAGGGLIRSEPPCRRTARGNAVGRFRRRGVSSPSARHLTPPTGAAHAAPAVAAAASEALRIENLGRDHHRTQPSSIGVALFPYTGEDVDTCCGAARRMYEAKRAGRNHGAPPPPQAAWLRTVLLNRHPEPRDHRAHATARP